MFEFLYDQTETIYHHNVRESEPALFVSMAACIDGQCIEVHDWISICDNTDEIVEEFKKESKRFLLNKENWLTKGDFRHGKFRPFKTDLSIPTDTRGVESAEESGIVGESPIPGGNVPNDSTRVPSLKIVPDIEGMD